MGVPSTKMRGVVLTGHGGFEVLEHRNDLAVPTPANNEVLIRVAAAAVNNTDLNTRTGWYSKQNAASDDAGWTGEAIKFPRIQGADVCGEIVAVGLGISETRIGDRVIIEPSLWELEGIKRKTPAYFGSECDGGFAEYTCVSSRHAHTVNSALSDVELASFPCSYSTAENMLTRSALRDGETVLITGASGGVGSAAIQLAKARGAKVIAITSPSKADALRKIGADQTLNRNDDLLEAIGSNSVDVVVDLVAGPQWPTLLDVLRPGGRYAVSGVIGGPIVELDVRTLYLKDLSFFGCTVLDANVIARLVTLIESGKIRPLVAETYPLGDIVKAQQSFDKKSHIGKIVLKID